MKKTLIIPLLLSQLAASSFSLAQSSPPDSMLTGQMALNLTPSAQVPFNTIPSRVGKQGVDDLYQQFASHYHGFGISDKNRTLDFDFIMGLDNSQRAIKLRHQLSLAMSEKWPLDKFAEFGFISADNHNFEYDLRKSPHLALPSDLFKYLNFEGVMTVYSPKLLSRGFRQSDLTILQQYIAQHNPDKILQQQELKYSISQLPIYKQLVSSRLTSKLSSTPLQPTVHYHHHFKAWEYLSSYRRQNVWRNWGLELLTKLDLQRQRILKGFLLGSLNAGVSIGSNSLEEDRAALMIWEENVRSGRMEQQMTEAINQQNKESL